MKKTKTFFQSYLILCPQVDPMLEIENLLKRFDIKVASNSPDFHIVDIEGKNTSNQFRNTPTRISINDIREIKKTICQKPFLNQFKIVIIKNADKLTIEAQNALLKILEEPPQTSMIILTAPSSAYLLPTILSRVIIIQPQSDISTKVAGADLENLNLLSLLEETSSVTNPSKWLDEQIIAQYNLLKETVRYNRPASPTKIKNNIEKYIEAKKMIEANVNPKLVLFNLALKIHSL